MKKPKKTPPKAPKKALDATIKHIGLRMQQLKDPTIDDATLLAILEGRLH